MKYRKIDIKLISSANLFQLRDLIDKCIEDIYLYIIDFESEINNDRRDSVIRLELCSFIEKAIKENISKLFADRAGKQLKSLLFYNLSPYRRFMIRNNRLFTWFVYWFYGARLNKMSRFDFFKPRLNLLFKSRKIIQNEINRRLKIDELERLVKS